MLIRIAHSPDPDDAFMFYGLSSGAVDPSRYQFEHILEDVQTLNDRAARGVGVEFYPEPKKLGGQLKYADRRGFRLAIIVGEDEWSAGNGRTSRIRPLGRRRSIVTGAG